MKSEATQPYLIVALIALGVAATTGLLLRFGLVWGMPSWAANYTAIRHAHSHLMYFGWVTLALMALIWHFLPQLTGQPRPKGVPLQMAASAGLALLSFPAFWANGYGTTPIGSADLPLGSIAAGLNGLLWLVFVALYLRATWRLPQRPLAVQLWDWALILLVLAFSGALGLVAAVMLEIHEPLIQQLALHLFLDLLGLGWFQLALLGLLWAWLDQQGVGAPRWLPTQSLALALVPTFLLGLPPVLLNRDLLWLAIAANFGAGLLLLVHLVALWRRRDHLPTLLRYALIALLIHIGTAALLLWPGLLRWSGGTQLRIFFLHNFLLGWISSALLALLVAHLAAGTQRQRRGPTLLWIGGVSTMILALLGVGLVQFLPISAGLLLRGAAWSSSAVVLAVGWLLALILRQSFPNQ
ncbi:MAG: hypothetical protein R2932_50470 [Caldilineaceae bacterium]